MTDSGAKQKFGSESLEKIEEEIADVMIFLTNLADQLGIDALQSANQDLKINIKYYPIM